MWTGGSTRISIFFYIVLPIIYRKHQRNEKVLNKTPMGKIVNGYWFLNWKSQFNSEHFCFCANKCTLFWHCPIIVQLITHMFV